MYPGFHLCCSGKTHFRKERVSLSYICSPSCREVRAGTQSGNLEAGTEPKAMEKCCWLICSPWRVSCFLIHPGTTCPLNHSSKQCTLSIATGQLNRANPSVYVLTKTNQNHHVKKEKKERKRKRKKAKSCGLKKIQPTIKHQITKDWRKKFEIDTKRRIELLVS